MGGQQSKLGSTVHEKAVMDRLQSLRVEDDYVEIIHNEKGSEAVISGISWKSQGLSTEVLDLWVDNILKDPKNKLALTALSSDNPQNVLKSLPVELHNQQIFNVKIPFEGTPITNQRSSGRCWLFASTNVFRVAIMKKYSLESFELSQAYLFYWDKLEKANWFLEQIIDTADEDIDSRVVQTLLDNGHAVSDGGQWDMVYNLVEKYGLVPQAVYPDSWNAKNSSLLNTIVKNQLRQYALVLRKACSAKPGAPANIGVIKAIALQKIATIMTLLLGPPPSASQAFTWQYSDKDGKAHELKTNPKDFARDIYSNDYRVTSKVIEGMVSLVHDPRHEPLTHLSVPRLGNVIGGRGIHYTNVDIDVLKVACIKMIKAGLPVFFGCDVGKFSNNSSGIMDLNLYDYELGVGVGLIGMNKADRLRTGESQMTHAMVLTAVHLDEKTGKPVRWRVQNSWGTDKGDKGWFVMSDAWMDEFVYQAVVDPRFCSKEVRDVQDKEPINLPLWDPMGSLA